jgi:toxin ParE1/3/4
MNVRFAPRAERDLKTIGARSRKVFGDAVAAALETTIRATIARIAVMPQSGLRVPRRHGMRLVPLVRYPFKIFYSIADDTVTILHIRHASRRSWVGE